MKKHLINIFVTLILFSCSKEDINSDSNTDNFLQNYDGVVWETDFYQRITMDGNFIHYLVFYNDYIFTEDTRETNGILYCARYNKDEAQIIENSKDFLKIKFDNLNIVTYKIENDKLVQTLNDLPNSEIEYIKSQNMNPCK